LYCDDELDEGRFELELLKRRLLELDELKNRLELEELLQLL
jgi:hypothetical protein